MTGDMHKGYTKWATLAVMITASEKMLILVIVFEVMHVLKFQ